MKTFWELGNRFLNVGGGSCGGGARTPIGEGDDSILISQKQTMCRINQNIPQGRLTPWTVASLKLMNSY
jgi:hypothetical protein